jgi:hypothetical protein
MLHGYTLLRGRSSWCVIFREYGRFSARLKESLQADLVFNLPANEQVGHLCHLFSCEANNIASTPKAKSPQGLALSVNSIQTHGSTSALPGTRPETKSLFSSARLIVDGSTQSNYSF